MESGREKSHINPVSSQYLPARAQDCCCSKVYCGIGNLMGLAGYAGNVYCGLTSWSRDVISQALWTAGDMKAGNCS
ncbi:MAG: hypothetical protein WC533_02275 [Candidatus Pacearchaeota archaeon]